VTAAARVVKVPGHLAATIALVFERSGSEVNEATGWTTWPRWPYQPNRGRVVPHKLDDGSGYLDPDHLHGDVVPSAVRPITAHPKSATRWSVVS
jgi:hypothetical protein